LKGLWIRSQDKTTLIFATAIQLEKSAFDEAILKVNHKVIVGRFVKNPNLINGILDDIMLHLYSDSNIVVYQIPMDRLEQY
jgi:hypothetical protein